MQDQEQQVQAPSEQSPLVNTNAYNPSDSTTRNAAAPLLLWAMAQIALAGVAIGPMEDDSVGARIGVGIIPTAIAVLCFICSYKYRQLKADEEQIQKLLKMDFNIEELLRHTIDSDDGKSQLTLIKEIALQMDFEQHPDLEEKAKLLINSKERYEESNARNFINQLRQSSNTVAKESFVRKLFFLCEDYSVLDINRMFVENKPAQSYQSCV